MSNYLDSLNNIAEAIQEAEGSIKAMKVADMPDRIKALGGNAKPVVLSYIGNSDVSRVDDYARDELAVNTGAGYQYGIMFLKVANGTQTATSAKDFLATVLSNPQKISVVDLPEYDYHRVYTKNPFTNYSIVSIDLLENISLQPKLKTQPLWYNIYNSFLGTNCVAIWFDTYNPNDGSTYQRRTYLCAIVHLPDGDSSDSSY